MQNNGEDGEQTTGVGLGIQRFISLGVVQFSEKNVALQISWYYLTVSFIMFLPKKNMFLTFSLTWKKPTTPRGNTVYCPIFTILIFEAICLPSLMGSCPIGCFRWELTPLCLIHMSRRWVFLREAYCLWFFSVLKLITLSSLSWKVWKHHYSWMILHFVYVQSSSHMHKDLCNYV